MSQRRSGRPTLADVALRAGVGPITVSRALRRPDQVSPDTRARIEAAVRELNYVPDPQARVLASGRSDVIGVVLPSLTNNVYADVLQGIHDAVADTAFQVQIANTRYSVEEEDRLVALFASQRPAAMLVTGLDQSEATRRLLGAVDFPVVQIMENGATAVDMLVGFSHHDAAKESVRHLAARGYRRIGFLGARLDPRMQRRREGWREAMVEAGLGPPFREALDPLPTSVTLGRALFARLLETTPDLDAVFCANDDLALGALFECRARGLEVPGRIGIVGFNDLEMMAAAVPSITSIQTRRYRMGRIAIEMLVERIAGREPPARRVDLGFELVARDSTRRG